VIQKILNARNESKIGDDRVYIGRPSKWGNPFVIGRDGTRDEVIEKYREWILKQPELMQSLRELKGKHLVCWCSPEPCHGQVLLDLLVEVSMYERGVWCDSVEMFLQKRVDDAPDESCRVIAQDLLERALEMFEDF
jgi:Domain of unknown function (DUF4326)